VNSSRGFTLAETIVSVFILGLMLSAVAALAGIIINAPAATSTKSDTVMSAAYGLEAIERDIRQSDKSGIWACTKATVVTCTQPTSLTVSPYVAVLTAYDADGVFHSDATGPTWQAYVVYSQPAGSSIIYRTYETLQGGVSMGSAIAAVADALTLPPGTGVAIPTARSMSIAIDQTTNQIDLQLATASSSGTSSNSTAYTTTILARN